MSRCKRCGQDAFPNRYVCPECQAKWLDRRTSAFDQAVAEIGPLGPATHAAIVKRVKQLEREANKQEATQ